MLWSCILVTTVQSQSWPGAEVLRFRVGIVFSGGGTFLCVVLLGGGTFLQGDSHTWWGITFLLMAVRVVQCNWCAPFHSSFSGAPWCKPSLLVPERGTVWRKALEDLALLDNVQILHVSLGACNNLMLKHQSVAGRLCSASGKARRPSRKDLMRQTAMLPICCALHVQQG